MKFTYVLVVLALVAFLALFGSEAKRAKKGEAFMIKQISNKLKTVCPNQKKHLKQVLSIVSSVDLTLRFTHSRIGAIDLATKQLRKGRIRFGKLIIYDNKFIELNVS